MARAPERTRPVEHARHTDLRSVPRAASAHRSANRPASARSRSMRPSIRRRRRTPAARANNSFSGRTVEASDSGAVDAGTAASTRTPPAPARRHRATARGRTGPDAARPVDVTPAKIVKRVTPVCASDVPRKTAGFVVVKFNIGDNGRVSRRRSGGIIAGRRVRQRGAGRGAQVDVRAAQGKRRCRRVAPPRRGWSSNPARVARRRRGVSAVGGSAACGLNFTRNLNRLDSHSCTAITDSAATFKAAISSCPIQGALLDKDVLKSIGPSIHSSVDEHRRHDPLGLQAVGIEVVGRRRFHASWVCNWRDMAAESPSPKPARTA